MKKILFLLTVISFLAISSYAQKVRGGLVFSPVVSWMKPDTKLAETEKAKFGFNFGLVGDLNVSDNFAVNAGLLVNRYGGKVKYLDSIPYFDAEETPEIDKHLPAGAVVDYIMTYIEIPICLKGKTNEIGYITYFLQAGVNPIIRYKAKGSVLNINDVEIKNTVKGFGFGFNVGGGIEYAFGGATRLLVSLIYTNGLTDMTKTEIHNSDYPSDPPKDVKVLIHNISLRLGIIFGKK